MLNKIFLLIKNGFFSGLSDGFIRSETGALDLPYRITGIRQEVQRYSPDILCLQEVDMMDQITAELEPLGTEKSSRRFRMIPAGSGRFWNF